MSDTPRTDALREKYTGKEVSIVECMKLYALATQLERELGNIKKQRSKLAEALREMLKNTPRHLECEDFHHPLKDQHHDCDCCPPRERFRDSIKKAEEVLIHLTKGGAS